MRAAQTATPAGTPRIGVRARSAAHSPYNRVNSTTATKVNADLDEIIKNCPAVDVLLGGYATPRSSTHNRTRDQEHVSRPPNAFMVYRSYVWFTKQLDDNDEKNLSCVSKLAADSWKDMNDQARAPFHSVAALAKRKHAELYPDYKYAPTSRTDKPTKPTKKNAQPALKARERAKLKEKADVAAPTKGSPLLSPTSKQKQRQVVKPVKTGASSSKSPPVAIAPAPPAPATTNQTVILSPRPNKATVRSSNPPPVDAAPTSPAITCSDDRPVLSPLPIKGTWTAAWTTQALFYGEPPSSPTPSNWSSSSSSSTPLSTPELGPVSSRDLGYLGFWDRTLCGYPPKPSFRALRVPSPAISELELNEGLCFSDPWPDVKKPPFHSLVTEKR
jgi:HMG (high mobility group) box